MLVGMYDVVQGQQQAAAKQASLQGEMQVALLAKDSEIDALLAERQRLDAALAAIKGQISSAASPARPHHLLTSSAVVSSLDADSLRSVWSCHLLRVALLAVR